jgi:tetratricopeptide (TPR) repeat protein
MMQFEQAMELFNDQQYNAAQHLFEAYLSNVQANDINKPVATYFSAMSSIYLFHEDGENQVKRFVDNYPFHPKAREAYFRLGNFYYHEKNYAKAIQYYLQTQAELLSKTDYQDYQFRVGYAYFSRKAFEEAQPLFSKLKKSTGTYQSAAFYYCAYVNYELGNYEEALRDVNEASKNEAYASSAAEIRANIYYKQKKYKAVIEYVNALSSNRIAPATALITADAYFELKQYKNAFSYFQTYEKAVKTISDRAILYRMGYCAYKENDVDQAINFFEKVGISKDSLTQYSTYYLGSLYQEKGNTRFAINAFQQARSFSFDLDIREESYWQLAVLLIKEASYEQAIKELSDFLTIFPQSIHATDAKEYLTSAYLNTQAYELAINFIESLPSMTTQLKRTYQQVTFYQGADYFNKGAYFESVKAFQKSVKYPLSKERSAEAYFWMGESFATGRKYVEAINAYRKALDQSATTDDWYPALCYGIAFSFYNTKQYSPALSYYKIYVNQKNDLLYYADAIMRLGDCYYVLKQYEEASATYTQALKVESNPKDYINFQLGIVATLQNKESTAVKYFDRVITNYIASNYYDNALFQKALLTFESGNYAESTDLFAVMLDKVPQSNLIPYALSKRAIAYFNLKQYDLALVDYRHILRAYLTHPTASGALVGMQEIYGIKNIEGDFEEYLSKYKTANPEDKDVVTIEYDAAKSLYFNQNYDKAIIAFKNYIENYPDNRLSREATYYLADSYYRAELYSEGLPIFYEVIEDEDSQFLKRAISKIAEIELILNNYEKSQQSFRRLLTLSESARDNYIAWEGLMQIAIRKNEADEIVKYAELIIRQANINTQAVTNAYLQKGKAYFNQGKYELAQPAFLAAIEVAQDANAANSKYMLALMDYNEGKNQRSLKILFELNENFSSFDKWIGKSFLLIADNYYALDEIFQSKATFNSIIENSGDKLVVEEAKIKLDIIMQGEKLAAQKADSLLLRKPIDSVVIDTDSIND